MGNKSQHDQFYTQSVNDRNTGVTYEYWGGKWHCVNPRTGKLEHVKKLPRSARPRCGRQTKQGTKCRRPAYVCPDTGRMNKHGLCARHFGSVDEGKRIEAIREYWRARSSTPPQLAASRRDHSQGQRPTDADE